MTRHTDRPARRWRVCTWAAAAALAVTVVGGGDLALSSQPGQTARAATRAAADTGPVTGGLPSRVFFSPQALQRIYGVTPLLARGIDGRGETVVLPEQPVRLGRGSSSEGTISADLAAFDARFQLPAADLTLSRAPGYSGEDAYPGIEGELDAEMVHTIAPGAKIDMMFFGSAPPFTPGDLGTVMRAAAARGNIVSASFGRCERCENAAQRGSLAGALHYARGRRVTVIAASGDSGAALTTNNAVPTPVRGVNLPCSSPLVTCVGGTDLSSSAAGAYRGETVWNSGHRLPLGGATGGGVSALYARPGYQTGLPVIGAHRGVPDVAAAASGNRGLDIIAIVDGRSVSAPAGGTSAAAPLWAGIVALADQDAHRQLGFLNDALYRIGHSDEYHRAFHDITRGDNTVTLHSGKRVIGYRARPGWDPVTGWGSPRAETLVPLLGEEVSASDSKGGLEGGRHLTRGERRRRATAR